CFLLGGGCMQLGDDGPGLSPLSPTVAEARRAAGLDEPPVAQAASEAPEALPGALSPLSPTSGPDDGTRSADAAEAAAQAAADAAAVAEAYDGAIAGADGQGLVATARPATLTPPVTLRRPAGQSWTEVGQQFLREGRHVPAEAAFVRALSVEEPTQPALTGAGLAAAGQGQLARAERYLRSALVLDQTSVEVNVALGTLLRRRGDLERARQHLRTAFLVGSGRNSLVEAQLADVEAALVARRPIDPGAGDAVAFRTVRTGRSEYRLTPVGEIEIAPEVVRAVAPQEVSAEIDVLGLETGDPLQDGETPTANEGNVSDQGTRP
ncbi:MAG: hypothetical protein AAFY66_20320, partial [Pseudomonadota bacterium]